MDIKSIWMAGFHIGYNHRNKHGSDWNDEHLFEVWEKDNSAMCEANAQSVLSDVLTDEEVEDLQVRLYNHALSVICSELTAEERTRSRNNIIREWFGERCSRYVR